MKFSSFDRYTHDVVDTCMQLHGCAIGLSDAMSDDDFAHLAGWLAWRSETWSTGPNSFSFDEAVRQLVVQTLALCAAYLIDMREYAARRAAKKAEREKPFGCSSDCRAPDCGGGCSQ